VIFTVYISNIGPVANQ